VDTAAPGAERTDTCLVAAADCRDAHADVFLGAGTGDDTAGEIVLLDGADTLRITVTRRLAEQIFGRVGDALRQSAET